MKTWRKTTDELIQYLSLRNAMAAQAGRPCPIAARVLARLEASKGV